MSSKKLFYFFAISLICGLIAGGVAHASISGIGGTVTSTDGTPVAGAKVTAPGFGIVGSSGVTTGADGSYELPYVDFSNTPINAGDQINVVVTKADGDSVKKTHIVTAADISAGKATFNIVFSALSVTLEKAEVPADGISTLKITVTSPEPGDTITVSADQGSVSAVTDNGDDTYTATYTAPSLALTAPTVDKVSVRSAKLDRVITASITLTVVPTTVEVTVAPNMFTADTQGTADVSITVKRGADLISDEEVTVALSPNVGTLSPVTNTGNGTYSATYTSGGTVGTITLTATATKANESATAAITINAGPPAAIALQASPDTVSSYGRSALTATVTDAAGNGVGGLTLTATPSSGGTLTPFAAAQFGTYTATYTAPLVEAEGTETITVTVGGISAEQFLTLNPVPPKEVSSIIVTGTVYKEGGKVHGGPASGIDVTVTIGQNPPQMRTTGADGTYTATVLSLTNEVVARTGDIVTLVATDAAGQRGYAEFVLTNERLEDDENPDDAVVSSLDVVTDITATSQALLVTGIVTLDDGITAATSELRVGGLTVTVTNTTRNKVLPPTSADSAGRYSVTFLDPSSAVAETGDEIKIEVQNDDGDVVGILHGNLTTAEVDSGRADIEVPTSLSATSATLAVSGTVYLENGDGVLIPATSKFVDGELEVIVTNTDLGVEGRGNVREDGNYTVTLFMPPPDVAQTGNQLTIEVQNSANETVSDPTSHTLTTAQVAAKQVVGLNVDTSLLARINSLVVQGSVIDAGAGLDVTVTFMMNGERTSDTTQTNSAGEYELLFLNIAVPVAVTGDELRVDVSAGNGFYGIARINPLRSSAIVYENQPLVIDPIKLLPPVKALGGLSIDPSYIPEESKRISRAAIETKPDLLRMIPSGILYLDLLKGALSSLPTGFDPANADIQKENFGNAITPRPAWHILGEGMPADLGRWLNGDLLNLYVLTGPTADKVIFTLSGAQFEEVEAKRIPVGGKVRYTFQLEEERAVLFLPSWEGVEGDVFDSVDLMIDGPAAIPTAIRMRPNMDGVWEVEHYLDPGTKVSYYYQVTLKKPYRLGTQTVARWAMPDPRNLQVQDLGIVETLLAPEFTGSDLIEIVTTNDLKLRSVFTVPMSSSQQHIWRYTFDFADQMIYPDGMYHLDTEIRHAGTVMTTNEDYKEHVEHIDTQTFMVDRRAPTAELTVAPNVSLYSSVSVPDYQVRWGRASGCQCMGASDRDDGAAADLYSATSGHATHQYANGVLRFARCWY